MSEKIYAERDIIGMDSKGGHYCRHISAMTREGLHSKSDIAAELGFRDMVITELEAKCAALAAENEKAMEAMRQADEVVKRAHSKFSALADENMALRSAIENGMAAPETPATDAWKAEVLAQGVDMAACALDDVNQFNYANMLADLAQKLRLEAQ